MVRAKRKDLSPVAKILLARKTVTLGCKHYMMLHKRKFFKPKKEKSKSVGKNNEV
jgi:hypothetical protein